MADDVIQYPGELPLDAIVHTYQLDLDAEEAFMAYCGRQHVNPLYATLEELVALYHAWRQEDAGA
jgi:hypothetical protein